MSSAVLDPVATKYAATNALLALPDDGVERWVVDGEIEVIGSALRDKWHSLTAATTSFVLTEWLQSHPHPHGSLYSGCVGVVLRPAPELTIGIDLVYLNETETRRNDAIGDDETTILVAPITLAVEILSPSDTFENIHRKLGWFATCGVPIAWVVNPYLRTVAIHRPGVPPVTLNEQQELDGGAELPGFRVTVGRLFEE
jgi:Uma2 family endonuclease